MCGAELIPLVQHDRVVFGISEDLFGLKREDIHFRRARAASVDELLLLWTEEANIRTGGVAIEIVFLVSNNTAKLMRPHVGPQ